MSPSLSVFQLLYGLPHCPPFRLFLFITIYCILALLLSTNMCTIETIIKVQLPHLPPLLPPPIMYKCYGLHQLLLLLACEIRLPYFPELSHRISVKFNNLHVTFSGNPLIFSKKNCSLSCLTFNCSSELNLVLILTFHLIQISNTLPLSQKVKKKNHCTYIYYNLCITRASSLFFFPTTLRISITKTLSLYPN